jgi:acetyl/propionyl-CoA carboxylase alpha subunit/acetyl-CoA carboxylase carboxyltransferase component
MKKLLIANRGEVATRITHTATEMGLPTVAVYSEDDADSPHVRRADEAWPLRGAGVAAYLDIEQIVSAAVRAGCDALHPGYGLLAENASLARRCVDAGLTFVGPRPETLAVFGEKTSARALAERCGVRVPRGTHGPADLDSALAFLESLGGAAAVVKAVHGGGGRGLRVVRRPEDMATAYSRCRSEAQAAFGDGAVYIEALLPYARHVEVQVAGDDTGEVGSLGERDCSLQRRHQKVIEIAPCPGLSARLRERLVADALRLARESRLLNAGTFEFLVDASEAGGTGNLGDDAAYAFIEANPRLQVEHTVSEEVLGIDLVRLQLEIAAGATLRALGIDSDALARPRGYAIQVRVNAESIGADGAARPSTGTITQLSLPTGPGVRIDTCAHTGYRPNPSFDSLLVKVVVHSSSARFADAVARARRALGELAIDGLRTNVPFLRRLLAHPDLPAGRLHTRFIDEHAADLAAAAAAAEIKDGASSAPGPERTRVGAAIDRMDPLAVLVYGERAGGDREPSDPSDASLPGHGDPADGSVAVRALMQGTIVTVEASTGAEVASGQALVVMSAMKMEHVVEAPVSGVVRAVLVAPGDTVFAEQPLVLLEAGATAAREAAESEAIDLEWVRPDLEEVARRHALTRDASRPDAVARRRRTGQRTARENVADLCDPGTFVEYGALAIAAQRQRRTLEDLVERTPADGLVAGIARVNGGVFDEARSRVAVLAYDYTVLAGTQGYLNHRKKDRLLELAERMRLPVVFFTEGGGGRPGDTDAPGVAGLDCMAFHLFARLSGLVPLVGINSGRCFAGNAALLGCCDVVIATADSNIGMGGPAMIEGGGLGVFRPEEIGPIGVQVANGVVDVPVADEAEAVAVAKRYLSYFQGPVAEWSCVDQRLLRHAVPENRLRVYDVRRVVTAFADSGSVLELRHGFGPGMVTALARIEGRPIGVIANDPVHLAGAIDSPGADKAARFMQLCDAFDLPILFLCDTPGIMVGPEVEKTALVRHCCRMFAVGANLTVPCCTIVLRKSYGLGAQAMAGGSHKAPLLTVSWPTGEFGGMGLEGAVKLGFRKELAAIADPAERMQLFEQMVARAYERGKALNTASHFEIDAVIDPAESRRWVLSAIAAAPPPAPRTHKKRPNVDTW